MTLATAGTFDLQEILLRSIIRICCRDREGFEGHLLREFEECTAEWNDLFEFTDMPTAIRAFRVLNKMNDISNPKVLSIKCLTVELAQSGERLSTFG